MTETLESKPTAKSGLEGVVAADSALCTIDGKRGELRYCGYLIKELAEQCTFVEVAWLLWHDALPTTAQRNSLDAELRAARHLPAQAMAVLRTIAAGQEPMDALRTVTSALAVGESSGATTDAAANLRRAIDLTACLPTIVAAYHRLRHGQPLVEPRADLDHAANFLWMLTGKLPAPEVAKLLDVCLVLHAEHELNASTFAARVTAATLSDIYSAVTSAIGALKGPLHGGANTAVMNTLLQIGQTEAVDAWLESALARGDKIMGFGHRVYKVVDPRALILKDFARRLGEIAGETKWFAMSERLEQAVKKRKGIDINVDFYSASAYYAMGIAPDLFTPVFAISRVVGWTAHVLEQYANNRLIRPMANYTGSAVRSIGPRQ